MGKYGRLSEKGRRGNGKCVKCRNGKGSVKGAREGIGKWSGARERGWKD